MQSSMSLTGEQEGHKVAEAKSLLDARNVKTVQSI